MEKFLNKILLIYNHSSNIKDLNILLTNSGFNTYLAEDVSNGLEIAKIYLPDLIICDIENNGTGGSEIVKELHSNERTKIIPLIYLSAEHDFTEMRKIMIEGADDYIPHPFENDDLISSINTRLTKFNTIKTKFDRLSKETIEASGELPQVEDHVLVKIGTKLRIIKFEEIVCVSASKEYTEIITKDAKKYIIRKSLRKWLEILPTMSFLQIHRSTIINVNYVENLQQQSESSYQIEMKNCKDPFPVSVRNAKKLKKWFYT